MSQAGMTGFATGLASGIGSGFQMGQSARRMRNYEEQAAEENQRREREFEYRTGRDAISDTRNAEADARAKELSGLQIDALKEARADTRAAKSGLAEVDEWFTQQKAKLEGGSSPEPTVEDRKMAAGIGEQPAAAPQMYPAGGQKKPISYKDYRALERQYHMKAASVFRKNGDIAGATRMDNAVANSYAMERAEDKDDEAAKRLKAADTREAIITAYQAAERGANPDELSTLLGSGLFTGVEAKDVQFDKARGILSGKMVDREGNVTPIAISRDSVEALTRREPGKLREDEKYVLEGKMKRIDDLRADLKQLRKELSYENDPVKVERMNADAKELQDEIEEKRKEYDAETSGIGSARREKTASAASGLPAGSPLTPAKHLERIGPAPVGDSASRRSTDKSMQSFRSDLDAVKALAVEVSKGLVKPGDIVTVQVGDQAKQIKAPSAAIAQ